MKLKKIRQTAELAHFTEYNKPKVRLKKDIPIREIEQIKLKELKKIDFHIIHTVIRITSIFVLLVSCSIIPIGKRGVCFDEMSKVPDITMNDNGFVVHTGNSNQNSALLIYKIKVKIDSHQNNIILRGYQALGKKYRDSFKLKIKRLSKAELDNYEFYWMDPDKKLNKLIVR